MSEPVKQPEPKKLKRAEIYFEDTEDGQLACNIRYLDGADPESKAHQAANMVRMYLDSIMVKAPDSDVVQAAAPSEASPQLAS